MVARRPRLVTPLVRRLLAVSFADNRAMERILSEAELDWTVVRAPRLTDRRSRGRHRSNRERFDTGPYQLARRDLASALVDVAEESAYARRGINVAGA